MENTPNLWEISQFMGNISVMMASVCHVREVGVWIHHLRGLVDPRPGEEGRDLRRFLE